MITEAEPNQATEICELLISSITNLCESDHRNNPEILSKWLSNKTPENCLKWINDPDSELIVAIDESRISGVAQIGNNGSLYLCYVLPEKVGRGIGRELVNSVENIAAGWGLEEITLESTSTARKFYEYHGYELIGESVVFNEMRSYEMKKAIG